MKRSRLPAHLAKNASKLHKHVGELLTSEDSPYKFYEVRQEYRVSEVNPTYKSNREKFDWAILNLKIVIEIHGEQHYRAVTFGGISPEEAADNFKRRVELDQKKQKAAEDAGWGYVVVSYREQKITLEELTDKITEAVEAISDDTPKIIKPYKAKIPTRKNYNWPTRKIPSRPFRRKK